LAVAQDLARRIAANAPLALARVKDVLRVTQAVDDVEAFRRQAEDAHGLLNTEDAHEGALAFAEKRAPVWRGR
jgi:enoyl-CoA hydratase